MQSYNKTQLVYKVINNYLLQYILIKIISQLERKQFVAYKYTFCCQIMCSFRDRWGGGAKNNPRRVVYRISYAVGHKVNPIRSGGGGGGFKNLPPPIFCSHAKNSLTSYGERNLLIGGHDLAVRGGLKI